MRINRILIADDHELVLHSISNVLIEKFSIKKENIFMFTAPEQVLIEIGNSLFDLYILDLEFPNISGFDLIKLIRQKDKEAKIIVCTMHDEIWNINHLLEMEINGIVLKKSAYTFIGQAIDVVLKGQIFLCPKFREVKNRSLIYIKNKNPDILTKREVEVLKLIVDGLTSKEIAEKLGISENAVENHRKSLFLKLDVENVAQLVRDAICYRLIEL